MPAVAAPFGFTPVYHPDGFVRPVAMTIASAYATNIFQNQPIKIATDGTIQAALTVEALGIVGTFQGCEYLDAFGKPTVSNRWPASTVTQAGVPIIAYITRDPFIIYECQSNATLTIAEIGTQYEHSSIASAGSTATGLCNLSLNVAGIGANKLWRVIGLVPNPDNAWGDNFVTLRVNIAMHQFTADKAAF